MDKNKDPAFLFYSSDFLTGVCDLTMEERGQYITLICLQHQKGHLSEKTIRLTVGSVSVDVLDKFQKDEEGLIFNKRIEDEIDKRSNYINSRINNGKKGGRPKTICKPYEKPYAKATENHSENENINEDIINNSIINKDTINTLFETLWKLYPKKEGKGGVSEAQKKKLFNIGLEEMTRAIERYKKAKEGTDRKYMKNGSTFFNSGYIDYLDANYEEVENEDTRHNTGSERETRGETSGAYDYDKLFA